ncbi:hypothetical protein HDU92_007745 [Lobulomyces angularis]|nr:hypothetical protein HDU92_007745 [Lobulomyces angularis]
MGEISIKELVEKDDLSHMDQTNAYSVDKKAKIKLVKNEVYNGNTSEKDCNEKRRETQKTSIPQYINNVAYETSSIYLEKEALQKKYDELEKKYKSLINKENNIVALESKYKDIGSCIYNGKLYIMENDKMKIYDKDKIKPETVINIDDFNTLENKEIYRKFKSIDHKTLEDEFIKKYKESESIKHKLFYIQCIKVIEVINQTTEILKENDYMIKLRNISILKESDNVKIEKLDYVKGVYKQNEGVVSYNVHKQKYIFKEKIKIESIMFNILEEELIDIVAVKKHNAICVINIYYDEYNNIMNKKNKCIKFNSKYISQLINSYKERTIYINSIKIKFNGDKIENYNQENSKSIISVKEFDKCESKLISLGEAYNKKICSSHADGNIRIWNTNGKLIDIIDTDGIITNCLINHEGILYGGCEDGNLRLLNIETGEYRVIIGTIKSPIVNMINISGYIYTNSSDNKIQVIYAGNAHLYGTKDKCKMKLIERINEFLYFETEDNEIVKKCTTDIFGNRFNIFSVSRLKYKVYSSTTCNNKIYMTLDNGSINELDSNGVKEIFKFNTLDNIKYIITSFEDFLYVGSTDGCIKKVDPKSKTCIDIDKNLEPISAMSISYSILYVGLQSGAIRRYQL